MGIDIGGLIKTGIGLSNPITAPFVALNTASKFLGGDKPKASSCPSGSGSRGSSRGSQNNGAPEAQEDRGSGDSGRRIDPERDSGRLAGRGARNIDDAARAAGGFVSEHRQGILGMMFPVYGAARLAMDHPDTAKKAVEIASLATPIGQAKFGFDRLRDVAGWVSDHPDEARGAAETVLDVASTVNPVFDFGRGFVEGFLG